MLFRFKDEAGIETTIGAVTLDLDGIPFLPGSSHENVRITFWAYGVMRPRDSFVVLSYDDQEIGTGAVLTVQE